MNIETWTPLWSSIIDSTVWRRQSKELKLVWVTLLAIKDADGCVLGCSLPGLADKAGVTDGECEDAIKVLMAPDKYSKSTEYEGRRIEAVEGGWRVLNHLKYRDRIREESIRQYNARKQRERRARLKGPSASAPSASQIVAEAVR